MEWVTNVNDQVISIDEDIIEYVLKPESGVNQTFEVNKRDLIALSSEKWENETPEPFVLKNDDALLIVQGFSLDYTDLNGYIRIEGLLLTK